MRPMKPGAARSALAENIGSLLLQALDGGMPADLSELRARDGKLVAKVLGGALEQALDDMYLEDHGFAREPARRREFLERFWRYFNDNTWRLARALRASNQLDKIR